MRAALLERAQTPLVVKDVSPPAIGPRDVLVQVHACGVCHSDLHLIDGLLNSVTHDPFPVIPGHEVAGVVREVGAEVSGIRVGDRVGVYWLLTCGRCRCCLSGEEEACLQARSDMQAVGLTRDGGYAELVGVPADFVCTLPEGIEFTDAAPFFCAGLTMYGALKNAGLHPGQRAAILGIGGLGHLGIQIAVAMGAETIAITSTEAKRDLAGQLGAHHVLQATGRDVGKQLAALGGADVVVSTTLDFQMTRDILEGLSPLGTLALAGMASGRLPVDPRTFVMTQQRLVGSYLGSRQDLQELLRLAVLHDIHPIPETYSLEQVNQVHQRMRDNQVRFRAVLTPDRKTEKD
jgi:D-arabinose 1-dehydrogenase-like Zn-dependent alcohol dehydrogenase